MTRPDSRLLVPVSALPFVSEGARVWIGSSPITVNRHSDGVGLHDMLDASAPELRDGLPVRLDVLPWLLRVLGWSWIIVPESGRRFASVMKSGTDGGRAFLVSTDDLNATSRGYEVFGPWPDLTGLTSDEAARAVVVAAVVARGAK